MKIGCESCGAKYTISDEKVSGRIVKIKCKKCAETIVVNGMDLGGAPDGRPDDGGNPSFHALDPAGGGPMVGLGSMEEEDATAIHRQPSPSFAGGGDPGADADEWMVNMTDDDQRPMTTDQLVAMHQNGTLPDDTYVWKEGMGDWLPVSEVPELAAAISASGGAAPAPAFENPVPNEQDNAQPFAAATGAAVLAGGASALLSSQPAARRANPRASNVDLFGAGAEPAGEAPSSVPPPPGGKQTGERNENSVLFSLSALTAAENAAAAEGPAGGGYGASARPRPGAPPKPVKKASNERAGLDDIMSIGGGGIAADPSLAPPDLLAPPPPEPPPPPPPTAVHAAPASMAPGSMPYAFQPPPQKKAPIGLIAGIGGAIALLLVVLIVVVVGGDDDPEKTAQNNTTTENAEAKPTTTAEPKSDDPKPAETAEPKATEDEGDKGEDEDKDEEDEDEDEPKDPGADASPEAKEAFLKAQEEAKKKKAAAATSTTSDPEPETTKSTKKKKKATSGDSNAKFSKSAAIAALSGAAGAAQGCKKDGGPTGRGKATVTFAPSGNATSAIVGGPFAGSAVGSCVASIFRGASVPPFNGSPVTVSKSFSIK